MEPVAIIIVFFVVLAAFIGTAAFAQKKSVRTLCAVLSLAWAGLMFMAAGWAESLNYNAWYSNAASKMLESYISGIERGQQDLVLREMKKMTSELDVTYERRGNFKDLAERAAQSLAATSAELGGAANGSEPFRSETNSTPSAAGSRR